MKTDNITHAEGKSTGRGGDAAMPYTGMSPQKKADLSEAQKLAEIEKDLNNLEILPHGVDLTDEIMDKVEAKRRQPSRSWWDHPVWDQLFSPYQVRFAVVLFAGVIIGASLGWFFNQEGSFPDDAKLTGSISSLSGNEISYGYQHATFKMIPYQIGNLYYLNFMINSKDVMEAEINFDESAFRIATSGFLSSGNNNSSYLTGKVLFSASELSNFQLVLEKLTDDQTGITVIVERNNNQIIRKELFFK